MGCQEVFAPESLSLSCEDHTVFIRSQWPVQQGIFVFYRLVTAACLLTWLWFDYSNEKGQFYDDYYWQWFIFASNWSFMLLAISAIFSLVTAAVYWCLRRRNHGGRDAEVSIPAFILSVQYLFFNLAGNSAIVVSMSYWVFMTFLNQDRDLILTNMSRLKHSMNTIYVLGDLFIIGTPVRFIHILYSVMLGSIYAVFNALYFVNNGVGINGHHYAYSMLDWRDPGWAVLTCTLEILQATASQLVLYGVYRLRMWVYHSRFPDDIAASTEAELETIIQKDNTSYASLDQ